MKHTLIWALLVLLWLATFALYTYGMDGGMGAGMGMGMDMGMGEYGPTDVPVLELESSGFLVTESGGYLALESGP